MDLQKLKKLADLFGCDLAGWQIAQCHFLELDHGLMGSFPAITTWGKEVVVVIDIIFLRPVWYCLERRSAKVTSFLAIANPTYGIAFNLAGYEKADTQLIRIFSKEEIAALCQNSNSFRWHPGLIETAFHGHVREPIFA